MPSFMILFKNSFVSGLSFMVSGSFVSGVYARLAMKGQDSIVNLSIYVRNLPGEVVIYR